MEEKTKNGKLLLIYGPTSSGKTDLAIKISKYLWGEFNIDSEIISADSRQIYKGLNIGTNKPDQEIMQKFIHKFVDIITPDQVFSNDDFCVSARKVIDENIQQNKLSIIAGGTATYIFNLVKDKDFNYLVLVPSYTRKILYRKIEKNVDRMFKLGLHEEVIGLANKYGLKNNILSKTLGYREFIEHSNRIKKEIHKFNTEDLGKVRWKIKANTKKYAMHQDNFLKNIDNYEIIKSFNEFKGKLEEFIIS